MSIPAHVSITGKRPREEEGEARQIDQRPFTIRHPSRPLAPPRTFRPVCLLARSQLPLAYLDTSPRGTQLFSALVNVLEASHKAGEDGVVLIAAESGEKNLCAIERVRRRCYALCRLRAGVTEAMLGDIREAPSTLSEGPAKRRATHSSDIQSPQTWWRNTAINEPVATARELNLSVGYPTLNMRTTTLALEKKVATSRQVENEQAATTPAMDITGQDNAAVTEQPAGIQDVCEELAKHYLDALYMSRTSLAYFTKGPLSRARVTASSTNASADSIDVITFLRASILSSLIMDKKYREHIPKILQNLPATHLATPEQAAKKTKKKRHKWKPKRTKTGLFTIEQGFVERWWQRDDEEAEASSIADAMDAEIRRRCTKLRNRETFLQIILVLEVLALEASAPSGLSSEKTAAAGASESQHAGDGRGDDTQPESPVTKGKAKKFQHLPTHLEALLDKLCIWQSLESHSPAKKRDGDDRTDQNESNDELQNFCVEVVVPFFSSRIPEYATMVNKKLGGPSAPSPAKRTSASSHKSGDASKRKAPSKSTKSSLHRVSSEILKRTTSSRPVPLHRTSTDSFNFPSIKREPSEISMDSIPSLKSVPAHSRSASAAPQLQHFTKREVDLTAVSASTAAKIKRKRDVETKLKEAVEALKKPNRALAVKDDETRVDERFVKATSEKAKQKPNAARKRDGEIKTDLQVSSTPSHTRSIKATPYRASHTARQETIGSNESKTTHVPSSSLRPNGVFTLPAPMSTPSIPRTIQHFRPESSIQETPSRGFAKFMPAGLAHPPGMLETPTAARASAMIQHSPSKHSMRPLVEASPNASRGQAEGANNLTTSIYDALGWDDGGYEQLD